MSAIPQFEFATSNKIIFGRGVFSQVATLTKSFGDRIFIVTGKNQKRVQPLIDQLTTNNLKEILTFSVGEEPTTDIADAGLSSAREFKANVIIAFGGGSVIDTAKAIAAVLANGGQFLDYLEVVGLGKPLTKPSVPVIAIPTTSGTGAEVTKNAVLCSVSHKQKVSVRSPYMIPNIALVDPELTFSVPPEVTAATGLDAFTQVLESFVSNKANPITDGLCREGLRRGAKSLLRAYENGNDIEAREGMSITSLIGGLALANAKLGSVHGFAGPIGGMFPSAPHGAVCATLLPHCFAVNVNALKARDPNGDYLNRFTEVATLITGNSNATTDDAVQWIKHLCNKLNVRGLSAYGVKKDDFEALIEKASKSSSMQGNPIKLTKEELAEILTLAL